MPMPSQHLLPLLLFALLLGANRGPGQTLNQTMAAEGPAEDPAVIPREGDRAYLHVSSEIPGLHFESNRLIEKVDVKGTADWFLVLPFGTHILKISADGFEQLTLPSFSFVKKHSYRLRISVMEMPVSILTDPPGATLFLDGRKLGTAPAQRVSPGKHALRAEMPGCKPSTLTINVSRDSTLFHLKMVPLDLQPVTLRTVPPGAAIKLDNVDKGLTDKSLWLLPGKYKLRLQKSGFFDKESEITVAEGVNNEITDTLSRSTGTLVLHVMPADATILVNKEDCSGKATIDLAPGQYKIDVTKPGYGSQNGTVTIEVGKTREQSFSLLPRTGTLLVSVNPPEVSVTLAAPGSSPRTWVGRTMLTGLQVGEYELTGTLRGFQKTTRKIQLAENDTTRVDLVLEKGKASAIADDMVRVAGGEFDMGNEKGGPDEKPVHKVALKGFSVGRHEVTQKQWREVMGSSPGGAAACDECPAEDITWDEARAFIEKLNAETGRAFRLPTEAEWEFAARGGKGGETDPYSGAASLDDVAWYTRNSESRTHPVGQKRPNALGLYDMTGNVWEWCADWYDESYYGRSPEQNPQGPESGSYRVLRGGSWYSNAWLSRVSVRFRYSPSLRVKSNGFGLRLAED